MKGLCGEMFGWDSSLGCRPCFTCVTWPDDPHCRDCPLLETTPGYEAAAVTTSAGWSSTTGSRQEELWTTAVADAVTSIFRELLPDLPGPGSTAGPPDTLETVGPAGQQGFDDDLTLVELAVVALLSGLVTFLLVLVLLSCASCGVRMWRRRWGEDTRTVTLEKTPEEVTFLTSH
ncbi:uncharacterized protein LOC144927556 [Branchiostoma floridae x Branchiostoma belcheri]